eukprot:1180021-Prorocentrum_minimum.AAC.2
MGSVTSSGNPVTLKVACAPHGDVSGNTQEPAQMYRFAAYIRSMCLQYVRVALSRPPAARHNSINRVASATQQPVYCHRSETAWMQEVGEICCKGEAYRCVEESLPLQFGKHFLQKICGADGFVGCEYE